MFKSDSILVTGGAGFIGSNLCQNLIEHNFKVICLDNFDNFYPEEIKKNNISDTGISIGQKLKVKK